MASVFWIESFAAQRGLRYEPEADERWLRAWEPYTTLKTPVRYEHALHATGGAGSLSIARAVVETPLPSSPASDRPDAVAREAATWIAIVQDVRIAVKCALSNDFGGVFNEQPDLVPLARRPTRDATFDHSFATYAGTDEDVAKGVTPSLRRLLLSWRTPVHAELRPGGFVLAPVTLPADQQGLAWLLSAITLFGEKATKLTT